MSRYLLLFILCLPFIVAALLNALVEYKMRRISRKKYIALTVVWLLILAGIGLAQSIYQYLFSNNLTQTEPLSLFDVIQLWLIVLLLFVTNRLSDKLENLERRTQDLHQELSIRLSEKD